MVKRARDGNRFLRDRARPVQQLSPSMVRHYAYTECPANLALRFSHGRKFAGFGQLG
jgi:hypothetical protein